MKKQTLERCLEKSPIGYGIRAVADAGAFLGTLVSYPAAIGALTVISPSFIACASMHSAKSV